jgi:hypothetical protein
LVHNGVLLVKDQILEINFRTRVSNPSAHVDLC